MMKNKMFVLGLFLMAFTFLFAANTSRHMSKKKEETSAPATTVEIHPLIVPLEAF
jgi:flagellar basal body-associated protein FliL